MDISKKLKDMRKKRELSQKQVAESIDVDRVSYTRYENGTRMPTHESIVKLAKLFNVSSDYLLGIDDVEKNAAEKKLPDKEYLYYQKMKESEDPTVKALAGAIGKLLSEAERLINIDKYADEQEKGD